MSQITPPEDRIPDAPLGAHAPHIQTIATPREERRPTVFISYSHADETFAGELIEDLGGAGYTCWIDTAEIKGGDEWIDAIAEGILNSYALVVIVTQSALQSRWVRDEILWARENQIPIIPLMRENVAADKGFFRLIGYQRIPVIDEDYDPGLGKLLDSLAKHRLPAAPPTRSPLSQRDAELAYLKKLQLEDLLDREKYTPMGGATHHKRVEMSPMYERRPFKLMEGLGKRLEKREESRKFENAVEEILRMRQAVLLGESGAGKTTTLWKLAGDLMESAQGDNQAPIPLLVRLGKWTDTKKDLPAFIASQLGGLGRFLDRLLSEKRAALLLDGLNELPVGQRDKKYPLVRRLILQHPELIAVVSCRELDYTNTVDLGFDRIDIMPLDPRRIREFAGRYLGEKKGEDLFWRLAGGEDVRRVFDRWLKAGATFDMFWTETDYPLDVRRTMSFEDERIWREKVRDKHSFMELARNPYMLMMLASVYADLGVLPDNRGELFKVFVETLLNRERIPESEQPALTDGLAKIAYAMQIRRTDGQAGDALTVLPRKDAVETLGEGMLYLAGSASILSVGDEVRFTHQLLQEYFAAKYMDQEIQTGRLKAADLWPAEKWWERTNWEEAAILLAGFYSDDCSRIVEWVAEANPEVAAMCAVRSGAGMAEATRERLRSKWIPRLTDLKGDPEPKARAAVGRALAIAGWDNRKGVGIGPDRLPDFDWVEIPGGEFQYGDGNPPQKLTLPTFYISRYPVTYEQFQAFLDDPQGYADPKWFDGLAANKSNRRMDEQWFKFANHPREMVNWYQAMAFCRWLSWKMGSAWDLKKIDQWAVRLPTESEWEKAARSTDGRIYPYKGKYDPAKANTEGNIGETTAVGIYPNGASPYGVMDLSGNVWEWCLSSYDKPSIELKKENLQSTDRRLLRGGSWHYDPVDARAVFRFAHFPYGGLSFIGFRVVCCVRPSSL